MADEPMVVLAVEEVIEPIVEAEEQMVAPMEVNEEWLMAPVTPPSVPFMPSPSVYKVGRPSIVADKGPSFPLLAYGLPIPLSVIEDLSTRSGNLEYEHGQLVKKVIQVSDAEVAAERWEQVSAQIKQVQQTATQRDEEIEGLTQQVQALQAAVQQRDTQIQQLRLVELEKKTPPGPQ
ncbi:hypothetical protein Tco_0759775 [Tanacetum coccineum]